MRYHAMFAILTVQVLDLVEKWTVADFRSGAAVGCHFFFLFYILTYYGAFSKTTASGL